MVDWQQHAMQCRGNYGKTVSFSKTVHGLYSILKSLKVAISLNLIEMRVNVSKKLDLCLKRRNYGDFRIACLLC